MSDWLAANLRQRARYDAICAADRTVPAEICFACGQAGCGSAMCETKRRMAERQTKLQAQAAGEDYVVAGHIVCGLDGVMRGWVSGMVVSP